MGFRSIGIRLTADVAGYMSNIRRAGTATKDFAGEMNRASKAGNLDAVASRAGVAGLALAGMAGYAIKSAADFDKAMSGVRAATHAGAGDIDQLRKAALQAGKDTSFSATEAAGAVTELSKAGVATADILGGGLKGALSLAAAGQLDVGEAAETAASAMTQFRLSGKDIPHIADLLAAGAGKAQGSVHDMGAALNQSGLVASQFGLTIEESTGTLAAFASAGLTGSDAGTSFKQMLLQLANPAEKTRDLMEDLGIKAYDATGKFVGIANLAQQLKEKLSGLSQAQRDAALAQIFGSDAIRSANVLYQQGAAGIQDWTNKVNDQGYAAETARIQTDNLAGDIERLKGSISTLAIESGSGANGGLRQLAQAAEGLVDRFGALPSAVGGTLTVLAGVAGAASILGAGWIKLRRNTADVLEELRATGPAGEKAAAGLQTTTKWAGRAALAFGAMQVAAVAINAASESLNPQVDALGAGLEKFSITGLLSGEAARVLGGDMGKLDTAMKDVADTGRWSSFSRGFAGAIESFTGTGHSFDDSLTNSRDRLEAVDQALQQMVQGGNATQAAQIFQTIADRAAKQGVSVGELKKVLPGYAASLETAGKSAGDTATATAGLNTELDKGAEKEKKYTTAAQAAAGASRGQREALVSLSNFMKAETDPVFGFIEAQNNLAKAQKDATKAIKDHGKKSDEAKAATRNLAEAAIDLQGKAGNLATTFNGHLSPALRTTLEKAGLTKTEIKNLEKQFKDAKKAADDYDGKYEAKSSAPGAKQAKKELDDAYTAANHFAGPYQATISTPGSKAANIDLTLLWNRLKGVDGNWVAHLSTTGYGGVASNLRHLLAAQRALKENMSVDEANRELGHFLAGGGPVYGPGTTTSDSITAHLSAGEHVWTAAEVAALGGQSAMLSLRRAVKSGKRVEVGDETPGFARGGPVYYLPFPADVSKTKIPDVAYGGAPHGAATYKWIEAVVHQAFPGMRVLSDFRPGAVTLSGNRSYHAVGRAVDWPPSKPLAEWFNLHFMRQIKELITPWNSLNIHNGARHTYTGAVFRQHNFAGGNAHDHVAFRHGGTVTEPVFGVGASGRTYSFGENWMPERVTPAGRSGSGGGDTFHLSAVFTGPVGSRAELENWLTAAVDNLRLRGRV